MKKLILVLSLSAFMFSCKGRSDLGECIGLTDDGESQLIYKVSVRNAFWSFVGLETIIAPILWFTDFAKCPVRIKELRKPNDF